MYLCIMYVCVFMYEGGPKNNENFFLEGRGAVLPSAPARCVYVTGQTASLREGL